MKNHLANLLALLALLLPVSALAGQWVAYLDNRANPGTVFGQVILDLPAGASVARVTAWCSVPGEWLLVSGDDDVSYTRGIGQTASVTIAGDLWADWNPTGHPVGVFDSRCGPVAWGWFQPVGRSVALE